MTTLLLSVCAAILYFGWLWHDRSAASAKSPANQPQEDTPSNHDPVLSIGSTARTRQDPPESESANRPDYFLFDFS